MYLKLKVCWLLCTEAASSSGGGGGGGRAVVIVICLDFSKTVERTPPL